MGFNFIVQSHQQFRYVTFLHVVLLRYFSTRLSFFLLSFISIQLMLLFCYLNLLFFNLKTIVEPGRSMVLSPGQDENGECEFPLRKMLKKVIISQFNYSRRLIIKREPLDGEMANEPHASPLQKQEIIKVVITVTT